MKTRTEARKISMVRSVVRMLGTSEATSRLSAIADGMEQDLKYIAAKEAKSVIYRLSDKALASDNDSDERFDISTLISELVYLRKKAGSLVH